MSRRRRLKSKSYEIEIESLSHEGRGISHMDNKVIFTRGALPGEKVIASRTCLELSMRRRTLPKYLSLLLTESSQSARFMEYVAAAHFSTYRAKIKLMQNRTGFKAPLRGKPR